MLSLLEYPCPRVRGRFMHRFGSALALLLIGACTSPVTPESIDLPPEVDTPAQALPDWAHQPESERLPPDPNSQAKLEFVPLGPGGPIDEDGFLCNYAIVPHGLPAIDETGTRIVSYSSRVSGNGEGEDEITRLNYYGPGAANFSVVVFDRDDDVNWARDDDIEWGMDDARRECEQNIAELRAHVKQLNVKLAATRWRSLEGLDVMTDGPPGDFEFSDRHDPAIDALPLAERPVEMLYNSGNFILRIRAVKVLASEPHPEWLGSDEACSRQPYLRTLEVDRGSGLGLITYDYTGGSCLCEDYSYEDVVNLPLELFAEVDARPSFEIPREDY